jgi:hypothetical protein
MLRIGLHGWRDDCMEGGYVGLMDDMRMNRWMLYNIGINIKCASVNIFKQSTDKLITYFIF